MSKVRHEYFCKLNPLYEEHLQKHKNTTLKFLEIEDRNFLKKIQMKRIRILN